MDKKSKLFKYPLSEETAKFEYRLLNPNGKLSDIWLHEEYQKLSLSAIDKVSQQPSAVTTAPSQPHRENSRKRNAGDDDVYDQKNMPSCDDTASSDTDCQSQVSSTAHLHSYRSNGLVEPPSKRRLTTTNETSLSSAGATTFQIESPGSISAITTNNSTTSAGDSNNSNSFSDQHSRHPRTPNAMNSPTHTPISDIEEDPIQQLPLPSPSASPIQSDTENEHVTTPDSLQGKANLDSIENVMSNEPTTQSELVDLVTKLSGFLSEANQNHLVFKLLQKTTRPTLSTFNNLINSSLKRDILSNVPFEVTMKILSYLDYKTLLSVAQVCKKWFDIINNPDTWIKLLKRDKLITDDAVIKYELQYPDQLLREWSTLPEINSAQVLYKKRKIIVNRWMDPKFKPHRISVSGHGNKVVTCLQHDDEKVVTGVDDKCILIYSTQTGQLMKVLEGHEGGVWALKYTGNTLVTGSTDRTVRVWNMKTGQCTHIFRGHTSTIRCLDIIHPAVIGKNQDGEDIVFPEYPLLITGSRDHNIHVWKLPVVDDSQDYIETFEGEFDNPYLIAVLSGHTQSVRSISGYGNIIISGSYDSTVRVWDLLDDGHCTHVLQGHLDRVYSTAIDFHSKTCFSGSMDSNINVWNFETGELKKVLVGHASLVGLLDLVDDVLVSAAADATLRIWDAKTGELRSKLKGHGAAITCFEHDGLRVVSGSEKMLKLWNVEKGTFARDLLSDVTGGIWQVRFDYKRCVAAVQRIINEDEGETFIEILDFSQPLLQ
ncbi:cell division control protein 4 [Candida albicans P87]|nr:cell division control protein 4 [Candida albicans P94015]KGU02010.1 cell division control protein 4 [Candida albicans P87]KHC30802.1 cell division control protein 4 [Candida albicans Ca6]KHC54258.1 cell division control protein 4 [Candida albicans P75010]RLP66673.1 cell division control protein 4 [Candida albicans Ca529L]